MHKRYNKLILLIYLIPLYLEIVNSTLTIYLLVTLCALYPSIQAARIQPATALHEE